MINKVVHLFYILLRIPSNIRCGTFVPNTIHQTEKQVLVGLLVMLKEDTHLLDSSHSNQWTHHVLDILMDNFVRRPTSLNFDTYSMQRYIHFGSERPVLPKVSRSASWKQDSFNSSDGKN